MKRSIITLLAIILLLPAVSFAQDFEKDQAFCYPAFWVCTKPIYQSAALQEPSATIPREAVQQLVDTYEQIIAEKDKQLAESGKREIEAEKREEVWRQLAGAGARPWYKRWDTWASIVVTTVTVIGASK